MGGGKAISVNDLLGLIEKYLNKKAIINNIKRDPSDIEHSLADIAKIKNKLNWNPKYNIKNGVIETGKWFLENQEFINSIEIQE